MRYFSSPGSLRRPMYSGGDDPKGPGFPIRISADQSLFAAPHGFSQRTTSFIASRCQGIHQTPLRRLINPASNGQRPNSVATIRPPDLRNRDLVSIVLPSQHNRTDPMHGPPQIPFREPTTDQVSPGHTLFTMSNSRCARHRIRRPQHNPAPQPSGGTAGLNSAFPRSSRRHR